MSSLKERLIAACKNVNAEGGAQEVVESDMINYVQTGGNQRLFRQHLNVQSALLSYYAKQLGTIPFWYPNCKITVQTVCDKNWPTLSEDCQCTSTYLVKKRFSFN